MNRRTLLAGAGMAIPLIAGCLGNDPNPGSETDTNGDTANDDDGRGTDPPDADDRSIDGRLHNEHHEGQMFELTIRDDTDEAVLSGDEQVAASSTTRIPAVGRPGETVTVEVSVNRMSREETLALDVEPAENSVDGYVDVSYDGTEIGIWFTPLDEESFDARVDTPPHQIEVPDPPDDPADTDEWNADYLGEHMATEPSLSYERLDAFGRLLELDHSFTDSNAFYVAELITSPADRDAALNLDDAPSEQREAIKAVDLDAYALVVVQTGWGSGSIDHQWARVTAEAEQLHLHGYYRKPYIRTDDYTSWISVLQIEQPDTAISRAQVHLTTTEDRRITFGSDEGLVTRES